MTAAKRRPEQLRLPIHDHAADHKVLRALKEYGTTRRKNLANERRPCAEVAAQRIREFAYDLGAELEWYRWIAFVSREMGMKYHTTYDLVMGRKNCVGPKVVDQISRHTGIPVAVFYDEEV